MIKERWREVSFIYNCFTPSQQLKRDEGELEKLFLDILIRWN